MYRIYHRNVSCINIFIGADKTAAVGESTDTGAEMTEEEWNLRVAELNKHQVSFTKAAHSTDM